MALAKDIALWATIRADFLATGMRYSDLAKKHGVSLSTLKKRAAAEHWMQAKDRVDNALVSTIAGTGTGTEPGTEPPATSEEIQQAEILTAIETKRNRLMAFERASDAMMDRILEALTSPEVISPYSLKLLASALRDLREMQGLNRSELDIEEQKARIAKLKSDTRIVEEGGEGGIIFMPVMAPRPEPPEDEDE